MKSGVRKRRGKQQDPSGPVRTISIQTMYQREEIQTGTTTERGHQITVPEALLEWIYSIRGHSKQAFRVGPQRSRCLLKGTCLGVLAENTIKMTHTTDPVQ